MAERLDTFIDQADSAIHPVVDRVYGFDEAAEAYAHLRSGSHFGKVVVKV